MYKEPCDGLKSTMNQWLHHMWPENRNGERRMLKINSKIEKPMSRCWML